MKNREENANDRRPRSFHNAFAVAEAPSAGHLCPSVSAPPLFNPPLSNRGVKDGERIFANHDGGTSFSVSGLWSSDFLDRLDRRKKELSLASQEKGLFARLDEFEIYAYSFGRRARAGVLPCAYILDFMVDGNLAFKVYLNPVSSQTIPSVFVQLHYYAVRSARLFDVVQRFREVLDFFGFAVHELKFSRLDLNVTLDTPIEWFAEALKSGRVLVSAKKSRYFQRGGVLESIEFGTRGETVVTRIYDKIAELRSNFDGLKTSDLQALFPNDVRVSRLEFEVPRAVLKRFEIDDEEDLAENCERLLSWILEKVFRIEIRNRVNRTDSHRERVELDPLFLRIREAFLQYSKHLALSTVRECFLCSVCRTGAANASRNKKRVRRDVRRGSIQILKAGVSSVLTAIQRLNLDRLSEVELFRFLFDAFYKQRSDIHRRLAICS